MPGVTAGNRRLRMFRSRDDTHVHPGKEERDVENRSRKQFGPFVFDEGERMLWRDDQSVPLTPKASDLLAAFISQPGRLLSKDELLKTVWPDTFVEESNLAYHVFALRKALGDGNGNGRYIETVPKRGYRFTADVSVVSRVADAGEPGPTAADTEVPHASDELHPVAQYADRPFPFSRRLVIVALVLAAPLLYFGALSWREVPSADPPRALPLTSLQGVVRAPSLSPDGNYVVFTWTGEKQDNPDLYVHQVGAGGPHRVTTDPGNDYSPSWSPDGKTIAFLRRGAGASHGELWLTAPLGGSERKLADVKPLLPSYRPPSIAWCHDSRCVLVTDSLGQDKPDALFAVAVDTGVKRQLTDAPGLAADGDPAVSPDGRSVVFLRYTTPFSGRLYRLPMAAGMVPEGEPVQLTSWISPGKPSWMPDGREILFAMRGGLWKLDALHGGSPTRLPFVGQDGHYPVVSRTADGRLRLVYVRHFSDGNIWRVDAGRSSEAIGTTPVKAIASTRGDYIPSLSPDGRRIAFISDRSGEPHIWTADPDGSSPRQLSSLPSAGSPGFPRWSPDNKSIAFHGDPSGRPDVVVVPAAGGPPKILTESMPNGGFPSFSQDGRWVYFCVVENKKPRIWKIPVSGGAAVQITKELGTLGIEARDGNLYYVSASEAVSPLWRVPVSGGTPVKILDGVMSASFDVIDRGIYYIDRASPPSGGFFGEATGANIRLQFYEFATGRSSTIASNLGPVVGVTASRDGKTVFFSRTDSSIDELMVVNDFR